MKIFLSGPAPHTFLRKLPVVTGLRTLFHCSTSRLPSVRKVVAGGEPLNRTAEYTYIRTPAYGDCALHRTSGVRSLLVPRQRKLGRIGGRNCAEPQTVKYDVQAKCDRYIQPTNGKSEAIKMHKPGSLIEKGVACQRARGE